MPIAQEISDMRYWSKATAVVPTVRWLEIIPLESMLCGYTPLQCEEVNVFLTRNKTLFHPTFIEPTSYTNKIFL